MNDTSPSPISGLLFIPDIPELELNRDVTALWRTILSEFMSECCDGVGFRGIDSVEQLQRIACFNDWQPSRIGRAFYRVEWNVPDGGRKAAEESFTLFRLDSEALGRLQLPMFHFWSLTNEPYPTDKLFFFSGNEIIIDAEPHEEALLFFNLTPARCKQLSGAEPRILKHLNRSRDWSAVSSVDLDG
jgi:hypothetical protein